MVLSGNELKKLIIGSDVKAVLSLMRTKREFRDPDVHGMMPSFEREIPSFPVYRGGTFLEVVPNLTGDQLGVTSLDLRLGTFVGWSDRIVQNVTLDDLKDMPHQRLEVGQEFTFQADPEGNKVYYVTTLERISHSSDLEMAVDSKSTTGRVGCMTHHAGSLPDGRLVTILQPYAFNLTATCGKTCLSQACFRYKESPYLTVSEVRDRKSVSLRNGIPFNDSLNSRGLLLTFDTARAYRARENQQPIDMEARGLDWQSYFELIEGQEKLGLGKKTLYLLGSREDIELQDVMGRLSREDDVMTGSGAYGHFAGFVQPGFAGEITLEYYAFNNRELRTGDNAGVIRFDKVQGFIDENRTGSYQNQKAPKLPKMFKIN